jgi:hypothetical protein
MIEQLFGSKTRVKLLQLFYSNPNRSFQKFEYYEPLQQIFGGGIKKALPQKTGNLETEEEAKSDLKAVGHIDLAVYTGQFTRDDTAGVDLLIVGDVNPNALQKYVEQLEAHENKSLKYAVMSLPDFKYRQQIRDRFATSIANSKKQIIVDVHNLLAEVQTEEEE